MLNREFFKSRIFPVLFMLMMSLVFIGVTSVIYTITSDTIKLNQSLLLKKAVLASAGVDLPTRPYEVERLYSTRVDEIKDNNDEIKYYRVWDKDHTGVISFVFVREGAGLWGTIEAAIGLGTDLLSFTGMEIIEQNETPGLGGRIAEEWFKKQFRGKHAPLIPVAEDSSTTKNEFEAITGATYTTNAIKELLDRIQEEARIIISEH